MAGYALSGFVMIMVGDVLRRLAELPDCSIRCCITSPPYWGLRDYGTEPQVWGGEADHQHAWLEELRHAGGAGVQGATSQRIGRANVEAQKRVRSAGSFCACGAWLGHLGLEPTPELYIKHLVLVFREARRVLTDDGTLWLNIGDCYAHSLRQSPNKSGDKQNSNRGSIRRGFTPIAEGYKEKDLIGIPFMLAFALRDDGWWWRAPIIWSKPNPMPGSQRDRPTISHEYLWLMSKAQKYYYDHEAVMEPVSPSTTVRLSQQTLSQQKGSSRANGGMKTNGPMRAVGRNFNSKNEQRDDPNARLAAGFNPTLVESGAVESPPTKRTRRTVWEITPKPFKGAHFATFPPALVEPCLLAGSAIGDTVLDPFFGSGTTGVVALQHGRGIVGIELSEKYAREIAGPRIAAECGVAPLIV